MDTLQLNKINELAREYLRLGIAKGSSDAVEKARFQLAFETQHEAPAETPYDSLFSTREQERRNERPQRTEDPSPLDVKKDRFDALHTRVGTLENDTHDRLRSQQARIAQLEETIAALKRDLTSVSQSAQQSAASIASAAREPREPSRAPAAQPAQEDGPIASRIEQTIKGRTITSDDVSVDKIFYFGNR